MQNNKKINPYKKVLIMMTLVFFIFMFSGITLSYISTERKTKQIDALVFNEGDLAITSFDGNIINLQYPTRSNYKYKISITNTSNNRIYYSIYLKNVEVYDSNVRVILTSEKNEEIYKERLKKGENLLQSVKMIEPNTTNRYTITINNKNNKSSIKGLIHIQNESIDKESFQDIILNDNIINNKSKTEIGSLSKTNEGLITTNDNYGTTYYFRGKVDNNYAKIGNLNFRIIRINGDGTVKLILDEPSGIRVPFNKTLKEDKNKSVLLENSTITDELNSWLNNNLFDYVDYLVASNFCTDTNFSEIKDDISYSNIYNRINTNNYTLECNTDSYLSKVGFISIDEIIYAGGSINEANTNYYLYNEAITEDSWTTSSYSSKDKVTLYTLRSDGGIDNKDLTSEVLIRPVINVGLKAQVKGTGTKNNPYIIVK